MSRISFSDNKSLSKYNIFKGVFKRNKKILALSVLIFFISFFMGVFTGYSAPDLIGNFLTEFSNQLSSQVDITTISIFMHNIRVAFIAYAGGIIGIVTAIVLYGNGFILGSYFGYLMHGSVTHHGFNLLGFISYTLPHGIFEIPAFIIAGAAGFRLTSIIIDLINSLRGKPYVNNDYRKFKDSIALLVIAVILLVIAAIIEANFTISIGNYITGLNIHI